ncbi:MAG: PIN domain-containing protein [Anaerolineae bacterium]|nr:PIN domain-containing protein [Anaerolineae bacterium]
MTYLLDVNVLLALCDSGHAFSTAAHRWWAKRGSESWATCPITENGFVRIASNPSYPNPSNGADIALMVLNDFCSRDGHIFWADDVSLREILVKGQVLTHTQITDVYLLALAARHGGKLATFDKTISTKYVKESSQALEVISLGA